MVYQIERRRMEQKAGYLNIDEMTPREWECLVIWHAIETEQERVYRQNLQIIIEALLVRK